MLWLILGTLTILFIELPSLIKKKKWKEIIAFSLLLSIGFTLSYIQIIGLKVTSPSELLIETVKKFLPWFFDFMEP